jgi:hypothetical protein
MSSRFSFVPSESWGKVEGGLFPLRGRILRRKASPAFPQKCDAPQEVFGV